MKWRYIHVELNRLNKRKGKEPFVNVKFVGLNIDAKWESLYLVLVHIKMKMVNENVAKMNSPVHRCI